MPQEYPRVKLPLEPKTATISALAPNSVLRLDPNRRLWKAQDTIPGQARRILAEYGLMGSSSWAVPAGTVDPDSGAQDYPERNTWRTVAHTQGRLTAGCTLAMHCLYCLAGLTQRQDGANWFSSGAWAELRATVTWRGPTGSTDITTHVLSMEGSNLGTWGGAETTEAGADWAGLREKLVEQIEPPAFTTDPAVGSVFSEWSEAEIELEVRGGERIVHAIVYEVPSVHTQDHNDADAQTVHGAPQGSPDSPRRPQTDAADGVTFEHHRWGTTRVLQSHERQAARLGPHLVRFAANSHSGNDWDLTDQVPITITGAATPLRNLFDVTLSGYDSAHPGWIVAGSMAQLYRLNATNFLQDRAAIIPVRVRVDCDYNTTASTLRLQSSEFEWIDVAIPSARAVVVQYGYLASQVYGDHFAGILLPLITVPTFASATVYNITVEFWEG